MVNEGVQDPHWCGAFAMSDLREASRSEQKKVLTLNYTPECSF
jgi:hypothetical protein